MCAQVILAGQSSSTPVSTGTRDEFEDTSGSGNLTLPTNGYGGFGKTSVNYTGDEVWIEFPVDDDIAKLEAALWWPETPLTSYTSTASGDHNDIDFEIYDPDGDRVAHSLVEPGVFERATALPEDGAALLTPGTWKIRIVATKMETSSQDVYWTIAARR